MRLNSTKHIREEEDNVNPFLLNGAMFAFMLLITLLITLSPFRYVLPAHFSVPTYFRWKEAIENILFFLPLGYTFVAMRDASQKRWLVPVIAAGLFMSGLIELNQAYIPGRYPSVADVMENTLGALAGGAIHRLFRHSAMANRLGLALEIPLANLLLLLIPLCWIDTMANGNELNRLWLLFLLLTIGGLLQLQIFIYYKPLRNHFSFGRFWMFGSGWYMLAGLPASLIFPVRMLSLFAVYWLILFSVYYLARKRAPGGQRFEHRALWQIAPLFVIYLIRSAYGSFVLPGDSFKLVYLPDYVNVSNSLTAIFRHLEILTASTLIGYMAAQILNRSNLTLFRLSMILMINAIFLIGIHGLHPGFRASVTTGFLIYFCGLFGALIYQLQLHYFKWIKYQLGRDDKVFTLSGIQQPDN